MLHPDTRSIHLVSYLGPIKTAFKGNYKFRDGGVMQFGFDEAEVSFAGKRVLQRAVGIGPNEYTFYWLQGDVACARSKKGNGVTIVRQISQA